MSTLGIDPIIASNASRVAGWLAAHATLDHHSQCAYEGTIQALGGDERKLACFVSAVAGYVATGTPIEEAIEEAFQDVA
ncbi:MAG: hypothetical protein AAFQ14_03990 [Cyanobacteria bacterium J06621_12]